jgi:putative ABC transport system substrate-binding protein
MYQVEAFRNGLSELGYSEGRNVTIEYRWAENQYDRLPALATDLVRRGVTVIAATGGAAAAHAAKDATSNIPIVFTAGSGLVEAGLVASLNRPGGNVTGVSFLTDALGAKRVGLLREVMAQPGTIAVLMNPKGPDAERQSRELPSAAQAIGQSTAIVNASTPLFRPSRVHARERCWWLRIRSSMISANGSWRSPPGLDCPQCTSRAPSSPPVVL